MRFGVDCNWKGQVVGTVGRGPVAIHSSGQTISSLALIEGSTLGAGEEVDEVARGASGMGVSTHSNFTFNLLKLKSATIGNRIALSYPNLFREVWRKNSYIQNVQGL